MPKFVDESDLIPIVVHFTYAKNKIGRRVFRILDEAIANKMLQDPTQAEKVETLNTKFQGTTWRSQQKCFSESNIYRPELGKNETNWSQFSDVQLKTSLIEWDYTDADNRVLPVTPELIDALPDVIANELIVQYRKAISIDEGEAGN